MMSGDADLAVVTQDIGCETDASLHASTALYCFVWQYAKNG
jgi:hypothetical protein